MEIDDGAFAYCPKLMDLYCYAGNVPSTFSDVFAGSPINNAKLHVPAASVRAYKAVEPWNQFKEIVPLEEKTVVGDVNGDKILNAGDIVEVVNYIMGNPSEKFSNIAADINGDGVINAADIVTLVNIILGQ